MQTLVTDLILDNKIFSNGNDKQVVLGFFTRLFPLLRCPQAVDRI